MDYKMINPNGSPFSWQESREQHAVEVEQDNKNKLVSMLLSLFK